MKEYVYERNLTEEDKARARASMEEANQILRPGRAATSSGLVGILIAQNFTRGKKV